jgi:hypothetical protein
VGVSTKSFDLNFHDQFSPKCDSFGAENFGIVKKILMERLTIDVPVKGKGLPQQAEVAQGVPGRLRPRIFLTFGTTREVGR